MSLYFRGNHRAAVLYLLGATPLGAAVERVGYRIDDDGMLSLDLSLDAYHSLSSGEQALWDVVESLHGGDMIGLDTIAPAEGMYAPLDADCAYAVVWALGIALGRFSVTEPVPL